MSRSNSSQSVIATSSLEDLDRSVGTQSVAVARQASLDSQHQSSSSQAKSVDDEDAWLTYKPTSMVNDAYERRAALASGISTLPPRPLRQPSTHSVIPSTSHDTRPERSLSRDSQVFHEQRRRSFTSSASRIPSPASISRDTALKEPSLLAPATQAVAASEAPVVPDSWDAWQPASTDNDAYTRRQALTVGSSASLPTPLPSSQELAANPASQLPRAMLRTDGASTHSTSVSLASFGWKGSQFDTQKIDVNGWGEIVETSSDSSSLQAPAASTYTSRAHGNEDPVFHEDSAPKQSTQPSSKFPPMVKGSATANGESGSGWLAYRGPTSSRTRSSASANLRSPSGSIAEPIPPAPVSANGPILASHSFTTSVISDTNDVFTNEKASQALSAPITDWDSWSPSGHPVSGENAYKRREAMSRGVSLSSSKIHGGEATPSSVASKVALPITASVEAKLTAGVQGMRLSAAGRGEGAGADAQNGSQHPDVPAIDAPSKQMRSPICTAALSTASKSESTQAKDSGDGWDSYQPAVAADKSGEEAYQRRRGLNHVRNDHETVSIFKSSSSLPD